MFLKTSSLEIQVLNKFLATGSQLYCKLLIKPRADLNCYLTHHISMFFSAYCSYELEMEHLSNTVFVVTWESTAPGLPWWFLSLSMLVEAGLVGQTDL